MNLDGIFGGTPSYSEDWLRGTPASSIAEAKRNAKKAKNLMYDNGYGDSIVQFWMLRNGDYQLVKFDKSNKIVKIGSYKTHMYPKHDKE